MRQSADAIATAFGCVLREHRRNAGLSQERLALTADVDRTFVSMLERGLRVPTLGIVFSLAQALGVSGADLVRQVETQVANLPKA